MLVKEMAPVPDKLGASATAPENSDLQTLLEGGSGGAKLGGTVGKVVNNAQGTV